MSSQLGGSVTVYWFTGPSGTSIHHLWIPIPSGCRRIAIGAASWGPPATWSSSQDGVGPMEVPGMVEFIWTGEVPCKFPSVAGHFEATGSGLVPRNWSPPILREASRIMPSIYLSLFFHIVPHGWMWVGTCTLDPGTPGSMKGTDSLLFSLSDPQCDSESGVDDKVSLASPQPLPSGLTWDNLPIYPTKLGRITIWEFSLLERLIVQGTSLWLLCLP